MLDLDPGDLLERLGQRLDFVLVGGDRLGHHLDLLHALERLLRRVDEPFHLRRSAAPCDSVDGWNSLSIHFLRFGLRRRMARLAGSASAGTRRRGTSSTGDDRNFI